MTLSRRSIWILLILWGIAMGLSGLALTQEATGDGFTRGLNRIMAFLSWQVAAAILALGLWIGARSLPKGDLLRWLGRAPGWWAVLVLAAIVAIFVYGFIGAQIGRATAL